MKKLLFISYFFPPIHSVESTMALNAIKYLKSHGWEPLVVSSNVSLKFGIDSSTASAAPNDLIVQRTSSWENLFTRIVNRLGLSTDAMFGWYPFGLAAIRRLLKQNEISVIISRANPITSHLIARRIARVSRRRRYPWVVMFGDPWTQNPYARSVNRLVRRWREGIERRILNESDAVIVTTQLTKQLLASKYGLADKIHVLPNTYDPAEFDRLARYSQPTAVADSKLTLTYTGTLYGLRSPEPIFRALKIICEQQPDVARALRVKLIGSMPQFIPLINHYHLEGIVECTGLIPRGDTLDQLANSQVLLLIDAPSDTPSIFLPTKLVEYLAFGKPILAITPPGISAEVVLATNTGVVVDPANITGLVQAIIRYRQLHQAGQLQVKPNLNELNKYSAVHYAEQLAQILDGLTSR